MNNLVSLVGEHDDDSIEKPEKRNIAKERQEFLVKEAFAGK